MYPELRERWAFPLHHEKEICKFKLNEIRYVEFSIFSIASILIWTMSLVTRWYILAGIPVILLFLLFPLLVRPWDIVLSNKRLILRSNYWNIGRFSRVISFKLDQLDTSTVMPRVKIIPLLLGFSVLSGFFIPLFDYWITGTIPLPVLVQVAVTFAVFSGLLGEHFMHGLQHYIHQMIAPYETYILLALVLSFVIGAGLLVIGMPHRKMVVLSSVGGHQLSIKVGFPDVLSDYLDGVSRKHRVRRSNTWDWDLPLLEDEEVLFQGKVGLVDKYQLLLTVLSVLVLAQSIVNWLTEPHPFTLHIVLLFVLDLFLVFLIFQSLIVSKRYVRIRSTDHRILFQEERSTISGIYGKRLYQYTDLDFSNIQGYSYSKFTVIRAQTFAVALILYLLGTSLTVVLQSPVIIAVTFIMILLSMLFDYSSYTDLQIISISGSRVGITYRVPVFMEKLSHRLEDHSKIYSKLFPNLLPEDAVIGILNSIRHVKSRQKEGKEVHSVKYKDLVDEDLEPVAKWEHIAPHRFAVISVVLGSSISLIVLAMTAPWFSAPLRWVYVTVTLLSLLVVSMKLTVLVRNTLVLYDNRLFRVQETLPRSVALFFGIIPFKTLEEMSLKYMTVLDYRYRIGGNIQRVLSTLSLELVLYVIVRARPLIKEFPLGTMVVVIALVMMSVQIPIILFEASRLFPRYTLSIMGRTGGFYIPYMRQLGDFVKKIEEVTSR